MTGGVTPGWAVPPGQMDAAAVVHHEFFSSYVRAGFTRAEAVQILIAVITSAIPGGPPA